jgi:hypothetical protein
VKARVETVVIGAALLAIVLFYTWTVLSTNHYNLKISGPQYDYYNLLAAGMRERHLHMKVDVPQEILEAENPYDPATRPAKGALHDASYYKGRYYLYFGVTPVLLLFLPFSLLVGHDLPQAAGNLLFACGGFVIASSIFLAVRRRYFPEAGMICAVLGVLALGLASMVPAVLRRSSIWELPIATGYCFAMALIGCLYLALHRRSAARWMALAGLSLGLAVGARPTYIVASLAFLAPMTWFWWADARKGASGWLPGSSWWKLALAAGVTLGTVIAGLLWYNYARFGDPFEFGLNYQLTGAYEAKVTHFSLRYAPFNFHVYYLAAAQWGRYFPFIHVIHPPSPPDGYYGIEFVYGVLICLPVVWLAMAAPLGWLKRPADDQGRLIVFTSVVALVYLPMAAMMLCFVTAAARYMVDFVPALVLLALLGVLALERTLRGLTRSIARLVWVALAAFSMFFGLMASFQLHDLLRQLDPVAYRKIGYALNHPSHWFEKISGEAHGPLEMTVRFSPDRQVGDLEVLFSTGWEYETDRVLVHYSDEQHVRLVIDHTSHRIHWSSPLRLEFGRPYRLRVELGSLFPPADHPFFGGRSPAEVIALTEWIRISCDDVLVLEARQRLYDASPESIVLGGNRFSRTVSHPFSGEISDVRRGEYNWVYGRQGLYGAVGLRVLLNEEAKRRNFPLISSGDAARHNIVYVRIEDQNRVRFGFLHSGGDTLESEPVSIVLRDLHDVEIRYGSLLAPLDDPSQAVADTLLVKLNERVVWAQRVIYHPSQASQIVVAANTVGSLAVERFFEGDVYSIGRVADGRLWDATPSDSVRLDLVMPRDRAGRSEPLIVVGEPGRADLLFVTYLDDNYIRFGLDHWGHAVWQSEPIAVESGQVQRLAVRFGALAPPAGAEARFPGRVVLELNNREVWRVDAMFHRNFRSTIVIGENRVGGSTCDPVFMGGILRVETQPNEVE